MNSLRRLLQSTAALGLLAPGALAPAQTQTYVQKTKVVKAAVLLLDGDHLSGNKYGQTAAPFAFYNLDQAATIKPAGWTFTNPYAPGVVTSDIVNRYSELGGTIVPNVGTAVSKRQGAYWTVRLSQLSETQIADYDVLLIAPKYLLQLTTLERERLRRFVDGGGVLWVDILGTYNGISNATSFDALNNLPLALQPVANVGGAPYRDITSPVLNGPKQVSDGDLNLLNPVGTYNNLAIGPVTNTTTNYISLVNEFFHYRNVASVGSSQPLIAEARVGDGAIVVTARGAAEMLNQGSTFGQSGNTLALLGDPATANVDYQNQSLPALNASAQAAARLAVNIASLGQNYRQPHGGSHNTSSASAEPGSPVLTRFDTQSATYDGVPIGGKPTGAVTYKGFLVETVGNRIVVMDAVPGRDLDGDGDPDDGIYDNNDFVKPDGILRDSSVGKPYDVVWISGDLGSTLSAPTCAEVPEGPKAASGQNFTDQILVTDRNGTLYSYPLVVMNSATNFHAKGGIYGSSDQLYALASPTNNGSVKVDTTQAPTVYDGLAYIVQRANNTSGGGDHGRIWVADLSTGQIVGGTTPWYADGANSGRTLPPFSAGATVGYIPAADSPGGADRVLYAPGPMNGIYQPGFVSLWLGAKGETPASISINSGSTGGTMAVTTRAGAMAQLPVYFPDSSGSFSKVEQQLAPHLTLLQNGVALNAQQTSQYITGGPTNGQNGVINFVTVGGLTDQTFSDNNIQVRIDYTIDWGMAAATNGGRSVERGRLVLPVNKVLTGNATTTSKTIMGPIALTARGTLHMIVGGVFNTNDGADSYYAIREDTGVRGQFRVVSRYTLYQQYMQSFGGLSGTTVPAVFTDSDAVQGFFPTALRNSPTFNTFTRFSFAGGVALSNGVAYAAVNAFRNGFIPVTMLAAFRAEPETAELRLGTEVTATAGTNLRIQQADWARSKTNATIQTPAASNLNSNQFTVDADNGVVRIENLATVNGNEITDCLSESQPIGVSTGVAGAYTFRQPDAFGDRWSPLLWFGLWNGGTATGTPLVAGDSVFIPAASALPNLLNGMSTGSASLSFSGVLYSVDADSPTTGTYAISQTDRPWIVQQAQIVQSDPVNNPNAISTSPYYRMPQNRGITSFADFQVRVNQTKLGNSTSVSGVGGGDGVVFALTDAGLFGLSRADFTVCDEGRLLRVDSAGNPVSNVFGGKFSGIGNGGSVAELRPLVRPVKAYPVGTSETLVVDAASNRIMRIDDDGTVLRSLDRILPDPTYKPSAYRANEPLALNDPRDVATYEGYVYKGAQEVVSKQQAIEYWIRYIVADAGNHRIVELADRFRVDPNTGLVGAPITLQSDIDYPMLDVAQVGVLVWQSPSLEQATKVGDYYNSISRVFVGSASTGSGRYVYVTGVSRTRPTRSSSGLDNPGAASKPSGGGGAVVVFDPLGGTQVFDQFALSSGLANVPFFMPNSGATTVGTFAKNPNYGAQAARPFSGLQAVTASTVTNTGGSEAAARVMVTDSDAVYEFILDSTTLATQNASSLLVPQWMINEAAFTALRGSLDSNTGTYTLGSNPLSFRPAYARRLDSGDVLIVNGYRGLMRDGLTAYTGEVTLLDGQPGTGQPGNTGFTLSGFNNLGFNSASVRFELPPLTGIRGIVSPVFADRR